MLARAGTRSLDRLRQAVYVDRMVTSSAVGTGIFSFEYLAAEDGHKVTLESDGLLVAAATNLARLHAYLDSWQRTAAADTAFPNYQRCCSPPTRVRADPGRTRTVMRTTPLCPGSAIPPPADASHASASVDHICRWAHARPPNKPAEGAAEDQQPEVAADVARAL
jgi:hypothetical protein